MGRGGVDNQRVFPVLMLMCALLFLAVPLQAQKEKQKSCPANSQDDSLKFYRKIKAFACKYRSTKWLYDKVFRDPEPKEYPKDPAAKEKEKMVNPYLKHKKKIIRNITVVVYDPFGHSVNDTILRNRSLLEKAGNNFHITTRKRIIRNRLLFKKYDKVDPLSFSESERIVRGADFVNDARIRILPIPKNKDSVDVLVTVLDKWSVTVPVMVTDNLSDIRFKDRNLLGMGQSFEHYAGYTRSTNNLEFSGAYSVSNFGKSFISSSLFYRTNQNITQTGLSFDRPFYSPLAKWAGGISGNKTWAFYNFTDTVNQVPAKQNLDFTNYDIWIGKSSNLGFRKKIFNQSTNLIAGARYYATDYQRRPSFDVDRMIINAHTSTYVGNIGFAIQQYYKDKFIYRFGANEDVSEGLFVQWLYGATYREQDKIRFYSGMEIARAKHFTNFGYASASFAYGMFYNPQRSNNTTMITNLYYFSDLFREGRWYFRQFVNYKLVHGENKPEWEKITLNSGEMYGFNPGPLSGNTKMILNLETVAYSPYQFLGFRFAPVALVGFGMLGDKQNYILNNRVYQSYLLGLMVRNENLLTSTFQVTIGLYPASPDVGKTVFKYNPVTSFTLRIRGFSVGRPYIIGYE